MIEYSIEFYISVAIFFIVVITFLWQWQDRKRKKPFISNMTLQNKNYFNVTIYNNASYNLRIKKTYNGRIWFFRKQMSIGTRDVNNQLYSDTLAKQKLNDLDLSRGGNEKYFKIYLELDEDVSEKTFIFKTNAGTCKYRTKKIPS